MTNRSTSALKYHIEIKHNIILEDTKVEIETLDDDEYEKNYEEVDERKSID